MAKGGHFPQAMQPVVKAVVVPMMKVPRPTHAVYGAIRLPRKHPTAEHRAPAIGPKKIPDSGISTEDIEKVPPVPKMGNVGSMWTEAITAAHTAATAG